jgi:hypothetical protein
LPDRERNGHPVIPPVLCVLQWGIFGAVAGAGFAVWLVLSHRVPGAVAGVIGVDGPLAGAGLAAALRLWWQVFREGGWPGGSDS